MRPVGLLLGPLLALATYRWLLVAASASGLEPAGRATLAMMVWMAVWWLTEAVEVYATALLPVGLFPLLGIADVTAAAAPYASPLIFLFLGGFLIALALARWGLDRRIALATLSLVGSSPRSVVGGLMLAAAGLSAFVSNTATAAMMLPIGASVLGASRRRKAAPHPGPEDEELDGTTGPREEGRDAPSTEEPPPSELPDHFPVCVMLGIAYACSIGGLTTLVGSPPNGFVAEFVRQTYGREVSFLTWLALGLPLAAVFLPACWLLLTRWLYPLPSTPLPGGRGVHARRYRELGPVTRGEWLTLAAFLAAVAGWLGRPLLARWAPGLTDAGVAMLAGTALFLLPVDLARWRFVLSWRDTARLPWGALVLFGGGLSLAAAVEANGVSTFLGGLAARLGGLPPLLLTLAVATGVIFLTELTSNTATAATLVPVLAALAGGLAVHPYQLIFPAALGASCAFMLPVATPPNAIVFGSGAVTVAQMARAGLWLNLLGIVLVTAVAALLLPAVLG